MSKWPMRGHFRYLRFKTFPMTPRTLQCEVFWALLSNSKHSEVPKDSKSPTLEVLGFTPTLGQSGVATIDGICQNHYIPYMHFHFIFSCTWLWWIGSNYGDELFVFYFGILFFYSFLKTTLVICSWNPIFCTIFSL